MTDPVPVLPEFLDTSATAARLGVSVALVRLWRARGQGPTFYRFGRSVRYRSADVDSYIEASKVAR